MYSIYKTLQNFIGGHLNYFKEGKKCEHIIHKEIYIF